jgi:hypothetical protein
VIVHGSSRCVAAQRRRPPGPAPAVARARLRARVGAAEQQQVRELLDLELRLLTGEEPASALALLPDRPSGKRALAAGRGDTTDGLAELGRKGSDAALVGHAPPAA